MKARIYLSILFIVFCIAATAQKDDALKNITRVYTAIEDSCNKFAGNNENDSLIYPALYGIKYLQQMHKEAYGAVFAYFAGVGYEARAKNDSALYYYKMCEQLALARNDTKKIINARSGIVGIYGNEGLADSVTSYQTIMLRQADTLKDLALKITLTNVLANIYTYQNQYEKAIEKYFQNIGYEKQQKDSTGIGTALVNIGNAYMQMTNEERKALIYLLEAKRYLGNYRYGQVVCNNNIGSNYTNLKLYDSAIIFYKKAIAVAYSIRDTDDVNGSYQKWGNALVQKKQFGQAYPYLKRSLGYFTKKNFVPGVIDGNTFLGELEKGRRNYKAALEYYKDALALAHTSQHTEREAALNKVMAETADSARLYEEAYHYQLQTTVLNDSLSKAANDKNVADVETKYQTGQKQERINLLNEQAKAKDTEIKSQARTTLFLLIAICFVLIAAFFVYRNYLTRKKAALQLADKNKELEILNNNLNEANQSKTKLFSIISHDLRAPVGSLFNYLQLEKDSMLAETAEQQERKRKKITQTTSDVLEAMEDILFWSKSQMEHFEPNTYPVNLAEVIDEIKNMHGAMADQKNIIIHAICDESIDVDTDPNFLKIIVRNLLSNGIKFTPAGGNIYLTAQQTAAGVKLSIRDDGPGMTNEQLKSIFEWNSIRSDSSGLGLRLTKEFAEKLNANITTTSQPGAGTTFTVTFAR